MAHIEATTLGAGSFETSITNGAVEETFRFERPARIFELIVRRYVRMLEKTKKADRKLFTPMVFAVGAHLRLKRQIFRFR